MIPMMLRLKIHNRESRGINLYIPLILLYLLLLPLVLILLPFVLIWLSVPHRGDEGENFRYSMKVIPAFFNLFCAARGTEIQVNDKDTDLIFKLI